MNSKNNPTEQTDFPLTKQSEKQIDPFFSTFLENLEDLNTINLYCLKRRIKWLIEKEKAARFFNNSPSFYDFIN